MRLNEKTYKDKMRVPLGLALALFILLVTSSVPLCHTCHHHRLALPGTVVSPGATPSVYPSADSEVEADRPCLACLFLNAINASQISFFLLVITLGRILGLRGQAPGEGIIPRFAGFTLQTRGPPCQSSI